MALEKDKPGRYDSIYRYAEKISKDYNIQNIWAGYETLEIQKDWYDTVSLLNSENQEERNQGMLQWKEERKNMNRWINKKREEKWAEDAAEAQLKKDNEINQLEADHAKKINEEQPQKEENEITKIDKNSEEAIEESSTALIQNIPQASTSQQSASSTADIPLLQSWAAYLLLWKEWYMDLHKMVMGTVIMYGADEYITVGTNILLPSRALTNSKNFNSVDKFSENTYLLAHVEAVKHNFAVSNNGARSFYTTIEFSRGIIVDAMEIHNMKKEYLEPGTYMLDDVLFNVPYDKTFDNTKNINIDGDSKIEGQTIRGIFNAVDKDDVDEEA